MDHPSSLSLMTPNTLGVVRPDSTETYSGLDQATAEMKANFEAETKAILRSSKDQS